MINNRQNGRRRGRGGNNNGNNQRGGSPGRPDSGNRIDSRARGNANQLYEKYKNMARDAQMSGDRVNTEYYLQFVDHYFRVLSETRLRFEEQNPNAPQQRRIQPVDSFDDFEDADDYGDEGEPIRAGEQQAEQDTRHDSGNGQGNGQGQRSQRDGRDGGRDAGNNGGREGGRDGGPRQGQPRYEGRRDERQDGPRNDARQDGLRVEGGRYDGTRRDGRGDEGSRGEQDRDSRYAATGSPIANDRGGDSPDGAEPAPVEARRRGRPRRVVADEARAEPAVEPPAALDADRLPPSLSVATVAEDKTGEDGDAAPRPRRRRARATAETPSLS